MFETPFFAVTVTVFGFFLDLGVPLPLGRWSSNSGKLGYIGLGFVALSWDLR